MKFKIRFLIIYFVCLNAFLNTNAQLNTFIQNKIDSIISKKIVPGVFVGVSDGKQKLYFTGGYANVETKKVFDENTFFEIGSITKTFTAYVLTAVLREYKIIDTLSIINYLPDSVKSNQAFKAISFLKLMNHTAGLPRMPENFTDNEDFLQPYKNYDSKLLFEYLKIVKPNTKNKYDYSNLGMALAGVLAERISGKTYAALLDKYIFLPFKIVDSKNTIEKSNNKSQGYFDDSTKSTYWNMNVMTPAGGLKCTTKEMLKYLSYMSKPIDKTAKSIIDTLLTPTTELNKRIKIGRGWHILAEKDKPTIYWHNGGTYGFTTFAAFVKETNQTVMVVVNKFNAVNLPDKLGIDIIKKLIE